MGKHTGDPGGRPSFEPTAAMRTRVAVSAGGGMTHDEIALAMGISTPTLRKYFGFELSHGAYAKRQAVIEAMHKAAVKGNVAAQKAYVALTPQLAAPPAEPDKPAPAKGKKEQAKDDAVTAQAGTDWGDLLPGPGRLQ